MRRLVSVLVGLALATLLVACTPDEGNHLDAVNRFRTANGLPALTWEEGAYAKVHRWSEKMAADGRLSHSVLTQGVPAGWHVLGENVAMNPSLDGAMTALEQSPAHRANLLNPRFTKVAVGVVKAGTRYWVTEVFIG
ncbi:MAG: SCP-like extracellular [Acidimicrobiales bacterium]|nr:SCP-like extracellular [Acidimicrobiales bacterium]